MPRRVGWTKDYQEWANLTARTPRDQNTDPPLLPIPDVAPTELNGRVLNPEIAALRERNMANQEAAKNADLMEMIKKSAIYGYQGGGVGQQNFLPLAEFESDFRGELMDSLPKKPMPLAGFDMQKLPEEIRRQAMAKRRGY